MQPTESASIPRRTLDVEDYIDIVRRHKGWIFGPFLLTLVVSVVGVHLWPDSYTSAGVIRIVPQQVPEAMVQSAVNQQMNARINSMAQQIRSRTVLTTIINNFGLYPRERTRMPIEDVIEAMNGKIQILPVQNMGGADQRTIPAFAVQFSYENRYRAQQVVQDLISRFIDENIRNRSAATYQTTTFIKDNLDSARKELDDIENKLAAFQMANNGRLPDQMASNMQQLQVSQTQVSYLGSQISRANQDKLQIEASIRIFKDQLAALTKEQPPEQLAAIQQQKNEKLAESEREIQALENVLANLRQHYGETWPDVQTVLGRLNVAKAKRDQIAKEESAKKPELAAAPVARPMNAQAAREARDLDATIRKLQSNIEAKDLEIAQYNREMAHANDLSKGYAGRIETVPMGQKQYADLLRERDLIREKYMDYSVKLSKAQIAQDMESRKQGETLELLDPASLPINPTEPKRPLVISIGAGIGLLLGVVIAGAREMKDSSLKNLKDVRAYTQMAILGSVPLLENDFVVRRRKRLAWLGWTTACLAAAVIMSGSVVYYYVTKV